jgi:hypothetical protein
MTEREQFEAWWLKRTGLMQMHNPEAWDAWCAWQARAALSQQAEPDQEPTAIAKAYAAGFADGHAAPPATQQAEPVGWITGPHGAFRANPNFKWSGPASIECTVPVFLTAPPADTARQAEQTRSQKLADAGFTRRPTTLEIQLKGEADDEAVRLLHHVRMVLPNDRWADDTKRAIDAYLAKGKK